MGGRRKSDKMRNKVPQRRVGETPQGSRGRYSEGPPLGLMRFLAVVDQGARVFILQMVPVALGHTVDAAPLGRVESGRLTREGLPCQGGDPRGLCHTHLNGGRVERNAPVHQQLIPFGTAPR